MKRPPAHISWKSYAGVRDLRHDVRGRVKHIGHASRSEMIFNLEIEMEPEVGDVSKYMPNLIPYSKLKRRKPKDLRNTRRWKALHSRLENEKD
jgi:hypothetical protein